MAGAEAARTADGADGIKRERARLSRSRINIAGDAPDCLTSGVARRNRRRCRVFEGAGVGRNAPRFARCVPNRLTGQTLRINKRGQRRAARV